MTTEQVWVGAFGAAATALALVALVIALLAGRRARRAESTLAVLAARVEALAPVTREHPHADAEAATTAYVITGLDGAPTPGADADGATAVPVARPIDGRLFVDVVARESVVKAASWTHGLRRALSAETRNRVRFAVRQESRRAGRERRAETKQALREFRARERAAGPLRGATEDVA